MAQRKRHPHKPLFRWRGFVALFAFMLFIGASLSGVLLYVGPTNRTARRLDWSFLGLDLADWWMIHAWHSFILVVIIAAHVWFNWKPLLHHAKQRIAQIRFLHRELIVALALTAVVTAGSVVEFSPFNQLLELQRVFRQYWVDQPTPSVEAKAAPSNAVESDSTPAGIATPFRPDRASQSELPQADHADTRGNEANGRSDGLG
ncbi:MAG: DUF4405 domain-containing protein [Planctomycetota bacterium]